MTAKGFRGRLLQKLSTTERDRLASEAIRIKNKPRPRFKVHWDRIGNAFLQDMRFFLKICAVIFAWILVAILAGHISPVLAVAWVLASCLVVLYGMCRFLFVVVSAIYATLTWKSPR
ncbi:hypothetical protein ASG68_00725 [Rhizobium sp. Leaf453]|nr:hypothetical protein ASG50_04650 [Rhizobium sp. Leaf386]KQT06194.1 hypothetical protein ASG42_00895 [Rhizobium sp. Leaf391]KQU09571.1 hypothetical protein ASG68_00725 [Rhizobium sp. Leaf453]